MPLDDSKDNFQYERIKIEQAEDEANRDSNGIKTQVQYE
jgi:hypothetical protein